MYRRIYDAEQLVTRALDTTSASGAAVIPSTIDPAIVEMATQLSPFRALVPRKPWSTKVYDRPRRTAFGRARAVGDGTTVNSTQSTYDRFSETMKILQAKGGTTGFLEFASQDLIDIFASEVAGQTTAYLYEEENMLLYGNASGDPLSFNGIETWTQAGEAKIVQAAGATVSTAILDSLRDGMTRRNIMLDASNAFWLMTPEMLSKVSAVEATKQRFDYIVGPGGFRFRTYLNIPIIETGYMAANQAWTGSTVTGSEETGSGSGWSGTGAVKYKVAAVLLTGETLPATEVSVTLTATTNRIRLSWSTPAVAGSVRYYKIYRTAVGGATNTEVLYTVIPGSVSSAESMFGFLTFGDVTSWDDTGNRSSMTLDYANLRVVGSAYAPHADFAVVNNGVLATDLEDIHLCVTNAPMVSNGPTMHVAEGMPMKTIPLAKLTDSENFLLCGYQCLPVVGYAQGRITRVKRT